MSQHDNIIPDTTGAAATAEAPVVSVLIAAYGQEKYLADALQSLKDQTFTDWEAIIVDDGSPDRVASVALAAARTDRRISFYHTGNQGVSAARNFAASKARGEYVICLDADDMFRPQYLERCLEAFRENEDIRVAYSAWEFFGENAHTPSLAYTDYRSELLNNAIHISAMMRRFDFINAGGFDTAMVSAMEDWEFWIRALRPWRPEQIAVIGEPLFRYRQKALSRNNRATIDYSRYERIQQYIFEKHRDAYLSILGSHARADMLMLLNPDMYDLIFNTDKIIARHGLKRTLTIGLKSAKRLSRSRNFRPEVCLRYIELIAARLADFRGEARQLLSASRYNALCRLTSNPARFMRTTRLIQALMPKNWGKSPARYL